MGNKAAFLIPLDFVAGQTVVIAPAAHIQPEFTQQLLLSLRRVGSCPVDADQRGSALERPDFATLRHVGHIRTTAFIGDIFHLRVGRCGL